MVYIQIANIANTSENNIDGNKKNINNNINNKSKNNS